MAFIAVALVLLLFSFIAFAILAVVAKHRSLADLRKLPGPKPSILFGNALQMEGEAHDVLKRLLGWMEQLYHEGIMCLWLGPTYPLLLVFKPDIAEVLLGTSKHMTKAPDYNYLHPWLGTETFNSSDGAKWKTRRRLITPTFHFSILNDFIQIIEEQAAILVTHLEEKADKGAFNILPRIALCTLDVICATAMDSSLDAQGKSSSPYVKAVIRVGELIEHRGRSPWLWPDTVFNLSASGREFHNCLEVLHGFTNRVIDERIKERAAKSSEGQERESEDENKNKSKRKKRLAFLDLLLEAYDNGEISKEGIREEVDTFTFEGHDTTAASITWALYLLGRHPEVQQKVLHEVEHFFETRPDSLTIDDMREFRYLECVLKESQRMFPSVPFFARTTTEDSEMGGYFVPKGTAVGVSTIVLHRNPDVWPEPLIFNPDRFLSENSQRRHPYSFLPFSAGPRNCIGQRLALLEEKLVIAHVLHHFSVESIQAYEELDLCSEMILRPKDGTFVTLTRRK